MPQYQKSKIVIIRLHSGIGNQLFQYNYLNYLKSKYNIKKVYFDLRSYHPGLLDRIFKNQDHFKLTRKYRMNMYLDWIIEMDKINSVLAAIISRIRKYNSKKLNLSFLPVTITDSNYANNLFIKKCRVLFINGVFFDRDLIQNETIDILRNARKEIMQGKINDLDFENSISIHVRGGDVLDINRNKSYIQPVTIDYYRRAVDIINTKLTDPVFYIFSNDDEYAQLICSELRLYKFHVFKRNEYNDLEALFLMSYCKHNIIANSTYSYWAALINDNKSKTVICTEYFLKPHHHLYEIAQKLPYDGWITLDNRLSL